MEAFLVSRLRQTMLVLGMTTTLLTFCSFAQTASATAATKASLCPPTPAPGKPMPTQTPLPPCPAKHHTDTSISLGVYAQLTLDRMQGLPDNGFAIVGTAPSAGMLSTFRQTFGPWLGYSANFGYARVSEHFTKEIEDPSLGDLNGESNVGTDMYEYSITYVAHTRVNKRFSLFGDAGIGGLNFLPTRNSDFYLTAQNLPTGVFGAGADLHLSSRFDLRAEYRGLFYKSPHLFGYSEPLTLTSEPTISVVYHLHKPRTARMISHAANAPR